MGPTKEKGEKNWSHSTTEQWFSDPDKKNWNPLFGEAWTILVGATKTNWSHSTTEQWFSDPEKKELEPHFLGQTDQS